MSLHNSKNKILISFFKEHYVLFVISFISGLFFNLLTLLIPIAIGKFYELIFGFRSHKLKIFEHFSIFQTENFNTFFWIFVFLIITRLVLDFINKYVIGLSGEVFSKELRETLFEKQLHIDLPEYEEKGVGKYLLRFSGDMKSVQNYLTRGVLRFSQDIMLILILLVGISILNWKVALIIVIGFTVVFGVLMLLNKVVYRISTQHRDSKSGLLSFVNIRLRAVSSIKAFNKFSPEIKRFNARSEKIYGLGNKFQQITSIIYAIIPAGTYLVVGSILFFVYYYKQEMGYGSLLALILIIMSFLPVFRRVLRVGVVWQTGNISFAKLFRVFDLGKKDSNLKDDLEFIESIGFKSVDFSYGSGKELILNKASVQFEGKGIYLIKGNHGAGKSTVVKLLLSLYKPKNGELLINSKIASSFSEFSIRKHITVVSSSFPLYGKDAYESIVYARNEKRKVKATQLLIELQKHVPEKSKITIDYNIGELGANLTQAQKMLLMYCRALMSNKKVLLVDEGYYGFNSKTKALITDKLNRLSKSKIIIVLGTSFPDKMNIKRRYTLEKGVFALINS